MKKRLLSVLLVASLAASMLVGCGSGSAAGGASSDAGSSDAATGETFNIGGIGPITGAAAQYGQGVMNAAQIAVDEINAAGGINGYQIAYNFQDDEHDAQKSVNAYNTLKDWGMQILLGCVTSTPCAAVAAESYNDRIVTVTPSASSPTVTEGRDNVFQICFSDPNQGSVSAQYIFDNKLAENVAVIYDSSDAYSSGIYTTFQAKATELGLNVVAAEAFTSDSKTDFSTQLNKAKEAGADLIFLPTYYTENAIIMQQANEMAYDVTFFGVDGMDGILGVENFDVSLAEGVYLLTPFAADSTDDATVSFVTKYQEQFGGIPNQFAADAYDGIYVIKEAIEKAGLTPSASAAEICDAVIANIQTINYNGLTGEGMTWNAAGEVSKSPKAVIIKDGAYVSVQ